jgi:hypothetical protein
MNNDLGPFERMNPQRGFPTEPVLPPPPGCRILRQIRNDRISSSDLAAVYQTKVVSPGKLRYYLAADPSGRSCDYDSQSISVVIIA